MRKKRINVSDEVFDKLLVMAKDAKSSGNKPNEKVENYFNNGAFFKQTDVIQSRIAQLEEENTQLKAKASLIDDAQLQRLKKLQALNVLGDEFPSALKTLIDSYTETHADSIQEAASKI
ncbi:hypothetical protein [Sulfurimonas indica]|uniref:hypothetical protein n=1 Tax=Sulfurimonas TaxID=202746 RepID=UPI0012645ED2|nr:hypothetical protein [Sulfurimonas indica]